jgi:5-methylcytosine-specific restriction enzyme A
VSGFPRHVRELVRVRSNGFCERCGRITADPQIHHRRPRGMGGSDREGTNTASNALWLCMPCHAWVESYRYEAYIEGFLVHQHHRPAMVPVHMPVGWTSLADDGSAQVVKAH